VFFILNSSCIVILSIAQICNPYRARDRRGCNPDIRRTRYYGDWHGETNREREYARACIKPIVEIADRRSVPPYVALRRHPRRRRGCSRRLGCAAGDEKDAEERPLVKAFRAAFICVRMRSVFLSISFNISARSETATLWTAVDVRSGIPDQLDLARS
jgi:hypothetical protein